jgi:hypothetical protein
LESKPGTALSGCGGCVSYVVPPKILVEYMVWAPAELNQWVEVEIVFLRQMMSGIHAEVTGNESH